MKHLPNLNNTASFRNGISYFCNVKIEFYKYQGTGNDFVMLDNMNGLYDDVSLEHIRFLCDRKIGVGADGLIKLSSQDGVDFNVEYFNADGSQSFCGNGARCSIAFAKQLGIIDQSTTFNAIDGIHQGEIDENGIVRLEMLDVDGIQVVGEDYFVDTGSPHYVHFKTPAAKDIVTYGKEIRYSNLYKDQGVNVNYLDELSKCSIAVETYERGVEDETLSCGTGVTGCALVYMHVNNVSEGKIAVKTKGGELGVEAKRNGNGYQNIWLSGPATLVFNGVISVNV